ncbi:MAG: heme-binding protein [Pseudomonadota bacterium]
MATETPDYMVVLTDGAFEIRDYPGLIIAEIQVDGSRDQAANAAFSVLADYIFGKNVPAERIGMTAPVTQTQSSPTQGETIGMTAPVTQQGGNGSWTIGFIMPARYDRASLPTPVDTRIRIVSKPERRVATVRFSGRPRDDLMSNRAEELRSWVADRGLTPRSAPVYAYYNSPFTPGFLRRNEVQMEIAR